MIDEVRVTTKSPKETSRIAASLGRLLQPGDTILLSGDLGTGKTLFSQGIALGLDVQADVTSPTYTLIAEYEGRHPLVHMDLYRLYGNADSPQMTDDTLLQIGFEDYLDGTRILLVEWPAGVAELVDDALCIRIAAGPLPHVDSRTFLCHATGMNSGARLREWVTTWLSS